MLTLSEELFLLTMSERKSSVAVSSAQALPAVLVGAMLEELLAIGMLRLEEGEKILLVNPSKTENECFNTILSKIQKEKKSKKITFWVETFSTKPKKLEKSLVDSLISKKVLKEKKKKLLWVIPFLDYSQADASAKFWRKRHIRAIILAGEKVDPQSAALLSLLKSCNLLDYLFTNDEMHYAKKRAEELMENPSLTKAFMVISDKVSAACAKVIETGELA